MWRWFWRPAKKYAWGGIFIVGAVGGIIFWGGFNTFMEYTNTLEFCISCHEMEQNVYEEYKKTVHYENRTGVRVVCADCHVPREWTAKLIRKIKATNELFHHLWGTIDTPEKFEAERLEMAEHVWAAMEANNSHECRNCHAFEAMDFEKQERRPQERHPRAMEEGKSCIDCHKGIAHSLPEDYEPED
jgi:nitrate/TMAO reductase-like tetraheme cytochrome c subunit